MNRNRLGCIFAGVVCLAFWPSVGETRCMTQKGRDNKLWEFCGLRPGDSLPRHWETYDVWV